MPLYLPHNLSSPPTIIGMTKEPLLLGHEDNENQMTVQLCYGKGENNIEGLVIIDERNYPIGPPDPKINEGYEAFSLRETEIVKREHIAGILTSDGPVEHPGFLFWWNKDNIYYKAGIYHYEYDEAVKIVESMIQKK